MFNVFRDKTRFQAVFYYTEKEKPVNCVIVQIVKILCFRWQILFFHIDNFVFPSKFFLFQISKHSIFSKFFLENLESIFIHFMDRIFFHVNIKSQFAIKQHTIFTRYLFFLSNFMILCIIISLKFLVNHNEKLNFGSII